MDIIIEMPTVEYLNFSGASDATLEDFNGLNELEAKVSGASKLRIREKVGTLTADINGASTLFVVETGVFSCQSRFKIL